MRNRIASAIAALAIVTAATSAFASEAADRNVQSKGIQVEQAGNGAASGSTGASDYQFHEATK